MEELKNKFVEEAGELLENLEKELLNLDEDPENEECINTVFRVVHSLKGSGGMFGFEQLSSLAHKLEDVYDLVREKKIQVTQELIDKTFETIEVFNGLLDEEEKIPANVIKEKERILQVFNEIVSGNIEEKPSLTKKSSSDVKDKDTKKTVDKSVLWIHFEPDKDIMKDGSNPLYMIDEISESGNLNVFLNSSSIPAFDQLKCDEIYVWWDILLSTDKGEDDIKDVFLFVEDSSKIIIEKISESDILQNDDVKKITDSFKQSGKFDIDELKKTVENIALSKENSEKPQQDIVETGDKVDKVSEDNVDKVSSVKSSQKNETGGAVRIESPTLTTIRVSSYKLDKLMDLVSEVITTQARLEHYYQEHNNPELNAITEAYQKLSRQLRENVLDMRLIPIHNILHPFRKLIRELSHKSNKEVEFITKGVDTELDKSIIEKLSSPLMHIIRNSIDHGIETKEERVKNGKSAKGSIVFEAYNTGSSIIIKLSDDGAGLDYEKIKQKAIAKGLINSDALLNEKELSNLIFLPGFSTTDEVNDISGRGVGMDVVKKNIEELRGEIDVESKPGKGTTITLILPLTLSIIDGLLFQVNSNKYLIQMDEIKQIHNVRESDLNSFDNIIIKEGNQYPYIDLTEKFVDENSKRETPVYMLLLNFESNEVGFLINKIIGKYQAVIKPLGKYLSKMDVFSGASILGDGNIALVMDVYKTVSKFHGLNY